MKYRLLIYADQRRGTEAERELCYGESTDLAHEVNTRGQYLGAAPLQPVMTAISVRAREGKHSVTVGPLAETREQLGGFITIKAKDLDEAIGVADRIPAARKGTVEIRPVIDIPGLPTEWTR